MFQVFVVVYVSGPKTHVLATGGASSNQGILQVCQFTCSTDLGLVFYPCLDCFSDFYVARILGTVAVHFFVVLVVSIIFSCATIFEASFSVAFCSLSLSCMFITINSGSILFYLFIYCLSCLNINRVCKTFLFLYNCFTSFHLFDSLARTSC